MDDYTAEVIASGNDTPAPRLLPARNQNESGTSTPRSGSGLRGGFAAIREKAGFQDRLMERYVSAQKGGLDAWLRRA